MNPYVYRPLRFALVKISGADPVANDGIAVLVVAVAEARF